MVQFPSGGRVVDGELPVDVDGQRDARRHEDRIETLGLAFLQPLGNSIGAACSGTAEEVFTDIAGDALGDAAGTADDSGGLGGRYRLGRRLHGLDTDALGE